MSFGGRPFRAVPACFVLHHDSGQNRAGTEQRAERWPEAGGRVRVAARCVTNHFWFMVWCNTGAPAVYVDRGAAGSALVVLSVAYAVYSSWNLSVQCSCLLCYGLE